MADRVEVCTISAPMLRLVLRGPTSTAAAVSLAFGPTLPTAPCRAAESNDRAALWLGPDEWLLLAPAEQSDALIQSLTKALDGHPNSLVDVSHRQVALEVRGPEAEVTLAAFVALDLDARAFSVGMCTRTLLAKAEIVLWRRAADRFHLEIGRSFLPYVSDCLDEAMREFT